MNRIDRLFGLLVLLQSRKYLPAETIAEQFGISIRTVYRDIRALGEIGVPVTFEPQRGYCLVPGYFLPPVSFSSEEANALLLMESMTTAFADKSIAHYYESALNKVKAVLKGHQKEKVEGMGEKIRIQFPDRLRNDYEYLAVLQQAVTEKHRVLLKYKNNKEELSEREAEPIGLIFYAFSWHLIAWCHLRQEYRDFKVSRIQEVRNTGLPFQQQEHMELSAYMKLLPVGY